MKTINEYLKLKGVKQVSLYEFVPKTKSDLTTIIEDRIN